MVHEPLKNPTKPGADAREPIRPEPEPEQQPERQPAKERPDADPPRREEGVVSDPDFRRPAELAREVAPAAPAPGS